MNGIFVFNLIVASLVLAQIPAGAEKKRLAKSDYLIRITPVEFFSGELKRLKAHHDFLSAVCFKIKTNGDVTCVPDVIMLRDGNRVDRQSYAYKIDNDSDEISLTLREHPPNKEELIWYRASIGGIRNFARYLERPELPSSLKVMFGPVSICQPCELKPGTESVVVWAMGGGDGVDLSKPGKAHEQIRRLPWAMILELRAEKKSR